MADAPAPLADLPDAQKAALARWVMRSLARIDAANRGTPPADEALSLPENARVRRVADTGAALDPSASPEPGRRIRHAGRRRLACRIDDALSVFGGPRIAA